ncbi:DNA-binding response regulator [Heyndrickxia sporothermodurans]|nr:DNA-binding response regulator [Heyndrickxia sporothermodurans]
MKVLIVDDDALIRDGLKILLELEKDFSVVGAATNGKEAFELCQKERPDIVLMDIRMPIMDGVLGTKLIKQHMPAIKVVILTTFKDDDYIKEAIKSGAEGYILKNQPSDSIMECLRTVGKGNTVFEKEVASTLSMMLKEEKKTPTNLNLSTRELEVLSLIAEGLSNKEIAERIYLSEGTTRNYVTVLLEKLQLRDRTQLAIFYLKHF